MRMLMTKTMKMIMKMIMMSNKLREKVTLKAETEVLLVPEASRKRIRMTAMRMAPSGWRMMMREACSGVNTMKKKERIEQEGEVPLEA